MSTGRSHGAAGAAVAAGNADTAHAAVTVLRSGGNAFDAAVAAGFAAAVAEPGLSSLGGGGFLLAAPADAAPELFDFFICAPGHGLAAERREPHFLPVEVRFAGATQVFHAGWGSVGVPGCLDGYLTVHAALGRLPLGDVLAPAERLARDGVALHPQQAAILELLRDIVTLTADGRAIFAPDGALLAAGEVLRNVALADVLQRIGDGRIAGFADRQLAGPLAAAMAAAGGAVTELDLTAYRVVRRQPLNFEYRGAQICTNPPPSFGGNIVAGALRTLEAGEVPYGTAPGIAALADALVSMGERHLAGPASVRGTTHVSVVDADGNVAAMTTSNGSCSGVFAPGTGIQLNNVMGEADLHPQGFHATPAGTRIGSMMAPTVVSTPDGRRIGLGSGGSERIRSALTCVLVALLDGGLSLDEAVSAPRLHWDRTFLQMEPGLPEPLVAQLLRRFPVRTWPGRDLYFGGAHAVAQGPDGSVAAAGDPRRGGVGICLS